MRAIKWWQNFHYWVHYPFKERIIFLSLHIYFHSDWSVFYVSFTLSLFLSLLNVSNYQTGQCQSSGSEFSGTPLPSHQGTHIHLLIYGQRSALHNKHTQPTALNSLSAVGRTYTHAPKCSVTKTFRSFCLSWHALWSYFCGLFSHYQVMKPVCSSTHVNLRTIFVRLSLLRVKHTQTSQYSALVLFKSDMFRVLSRPKVILASRLSRFLPDLHIPVLSLSPITRQ